MENNATQTEDFRIKNIRESIDYIPGVILKQDVNYLLDAYALLKEENQKQKEALEEYRNAYKEQSSVCYKWHTEANRLTAANAELLSGLKITQSYLESFRSQWKEGEETLYHINQSVLSKHSST